MCFMLDKNYVFLHMTWDFDITSVFWYHRHELFENNLNKLLIGIFFLTYYMN